MTDRFEVPEDVEFVDSWGLKAVYSKNVPALIRAEVERYALVAWGALSTADIAYLDSRYGPAAEAQEPAPGPVFTREIYLRRVGEEVDRAYRKHGVAPWAPHQFYGILLEEVDEVWEEIKKDAPRDAILAEVVQVAAVCLRYAESIGRIG